MTTIKVTPEQLMSVSKQFATAQSQIAQMNHILKQQLFEIERQWNGSAKERFYADFIAAQRVMDNFSSLSHSIAKTLEGHAEKFRLADQQTTQSYDANCMPPPPDECRAPTADNRNAFQKSVDSLKELGTGFMQAADDRYQKRYDSVGGFLDYWTFGIPSGLVGGYMDRADKAFDSPNDTANWLTFGIHGTIREAIFPTNAWSSEHWANMMGMGGMMVGGGLTAKMIKPHNLLTSSGGGSKVSVLNQRPGTGQMTGGFNGFKDPRLQVMDNIAESKKARESSQMSDYFNSEKQLSKSIQEHRLNMERIIYNEGNLSIDEGVLSGGKIKESYLKSLVPPKGINKFRADPGVIEEGFKYNFIHENKRIEIKWHSPQQNLRDILPEEDLLTSNSYNGWSAQIKIGKKYLGTDGQLYRNNQQNITHIPVDIGG
ncbi:WXG100 family type VII secretion target [Paenibacillus polysaccharolyticus]|uniref:WXG100 family type VII secretion target n=1 Tax=Paenibacillus polysaccharolyticus TaxID=582692 RepID=A0A1G5F531_9BACL|nr:WXG100 family type VII secretion target [Paenibacillus polysaccharolyticus]SCY34294.1 WXG100 family type VII secretion target [Paenibacillus polysaccharolyticus]